MRFSLSFLLVIILIIAVLFAAFRWSREVSLVHDAVAAGNTSVVSRWARRRPKLLTENQYYSPSMLMRAAVESKSVETLKVLAPVVLSHSKSKDVFNALVVAVQNNDIEMCRALLDSGLDPDANEDFSILVNAKKLGNAQILDLLLEKGADPTLALPWACHQEPSFAFRMLSLGADVNVKGALASAVRHGNYDLMQALLDKGANSATGLIGIQEETPSEVIDKLIQHGKFDIGWLQTRELTESLLKHSDATIFERVFPQIVIHESHDPLAHLLGLSKSVKKPLEKLEIMIRNGVQVTTANLENWTNSRLSSNDVKLAIFKRLFAEIKRSDTPPSFREEKLLLACMEDSETVVQLQIANMLIWSTQEESTGQSPLHDVADYWGNKTNLVIAKLLIEHGVDPSIQDDDQETPLHRAVGGAHLEMTTLLLESGADANAKDADGQAPLDIVRHMENLPPTRFYSPPKALGQIRQELVKHGARYGLEQDYSLTENERRFVEIEKMSRGARKK